MISSSGGDFALRPLAKSVGTSTTAVYSLFGSRQALVDAVALRSAHSLRDALLAATDDNLLLRLMNQGLGYRRSAVENPGMFRIVFTGEHHSDDLLAAQEEIAIPFRRTVSEAMEQGLLHGDRKRILRHLHSGVHGFLRLEGSGRMGSDPEFRLLLIDLISAHVTEKGRKELAALDAAGETLAS